MGARIACPAVRLDPVSEHSEHNAKTGAGSEKAGRATSVATVRYARSRRRANNSTIDTARTQVDNILPTGNVGKKRRAFSSACIFFHGVGLFGVGAYYVAQPSESLALIADAWGVSLDGPKKKTPEQQAVHVLAKNLVMVAAVYLAVWGATCMTLATAALPRTKKMVAGLNLVAATVTAVCSSFHPDAVASSACLVDRAAGVGCLKVAMLWHAPFVVLDVLGIAFAEAGPRLVRINDRSAVLLHGNLAVELYHGKGTTILKINSHADLIKYADDGGIKSD